MVAAVADAGPANVYTTGSITVKNAVKGETYYAIKALSATASDDGIAYAGPIPQQLQSVLEIRTVGTAPNTYQEVGKIDGVTDEAYQTAMRAFATAQQENWGTGVPCNDNSVTFSGLDMGFYVIVSTLTSGEQTTLTNKVSAGSTYDGTLAAGSRNAGTVYEKNTTTVTVNKTGDTEYSIGDTVTYTVTFNGANYRGEGADAQIVTKYVVTDTLPEFLTGATVTGITIGTGEGSEKTVNDTNFPGVSTFGTNKTFDIPWASGSDHNYTSLYPNGSTVTITYQATLTDIVKIDGTEGNKNTITIKPWVDKPEGPGPHSDEWEDHHEIFTHAAALKKTDGTNLLAGAKFQFYGLTAQPETAGVPGIYRVTAYNPTAAAAQTEGTELEVGADGKLYILGISNLVTLTGTETQAPAGYNKLTGTVTLNVQTLSHEVWSSAGTRDYDADNNLVSESSTSSHEVQVSKTIEDLDENGVNVVNQKGTELPSTGGMGTTILYVGGSILVILAAVLLITKRRMNANE